MKPGIPKGTRDFSPTEVAKRNYIFESIKKVFEIYGYVPIETPVMENLSTLTGKYGEEGEKLLFKILNNGDFLAKANTEALDQKNSTALISSISDRGLRYDLTVPFARYVTMHLNDIHFPFKRYQIQQVWRADRPQRGRYREFYQCDVDVIGSDSLMYEAELVKIFDEVFSDLGLGVTIKVNNRKILYGIAETCGIEESFHDMTSSIDKLDKLGQEGVIDDLVKKGIDLAIAKEILDILKIKSLDDLELRITKSEVGLTGIAELRTFHKYLDLIKTNNKLELDLSLARGLNYYTGCIIEVVSNDVKIGSIGGGGRYDDLTGVFGLKDVSGVGISFGAARIYDVMEELNLFPENIGEKLKVLLIALDDSSHLYAFECLSQLRKAGISADLYPDPVKLNKQMKYANALHVPYTILIGSEEKESGLLGLKDMKSGEQQKMKISDIISTLL